MSIARALALAAYAGVAIPSAFICMSFFSILKRLGLEDSVVAERVMLMLWPSSIMNMASQNDALHQVDAVGALAIAVNVLLYMVLGAFLWVGFKRQPAFLIFPVTIVASIWWWLLTG